MFLIETVFHHFVPLKLIEQFLIVHFSWEPNSFTVIKCKTTLDNEDKIYINAPEDLSDFDVQRLLNQKEHEIKYLNNYFVLSSNNHIPLCLRQRDPRVEPNIMVNAGALIMALNALRRCGKTEIADELELTAEPL